jgi:hypothetical protein
MKNVDFKNNNLTKAMGRMVLIFGRYLIAFGLGMLPIIIGLKSDWYVIPLVVFNFTIQFGLATYWASPYIKQILQK